MKKIMALALSMLLLLTAAIGTASAEGLTPGTYTQTVAGRNGDLEVQVTFDENGITAVEVTKQQETQGVADAALANIPAQVVEYQSIQLDAVTGATITSEAILSAVAGCIEQAGGKLEDFSKAVEKQAGEDVDLTADVVVIGAGGAGLTAAAFAGTNGASVIVLEKGAAVGGNTLLSGGILNAADPEKQQQEEMTESTRSELLKVLDYDEAEFGEFAETLKTLKEQINEYVASGATYLFDSPELHMIQSYTGSKRTDLDGNVITPNYELIHTLCFNALDAWNWLIDIGTPVRDTLSIGVGALWKRTHSVDGGANGAYPLIASLKAEAEKQGAEIMLETEAKELLTDGGRVVGVTAYKQDGTKVTVHASKGVVLATGGFAGNIDMVLEYNNYWANLGPDAKNDNTSTINGDGIKMAQAVGANTVGMGFIQMLPTCAALDGQAGKGVGSQLYVNQEGVRYVNETSERDVLVNAALAQTGGYFYGVGGAAMYNHPQQGAEKLADSVAKGYGYVADTIDEIAEWAGIDAETLKATIETFNAYVENENDPDFGRYGFMGKVDEGPYVIIKMSPALHHTMGGVEINAETQAIDTDGNVIPGLYAAGEVTGGIHAGNRLGGNAIADVIVFGRIAGENAAKAE